MLKKCWHTISLFSSESTLGLCITPLDLCLSCMDQSVYHAPGELMISWTCICRQESSSVSMHIQAIFPEMETKSMGEGLDH